MCVCVYYTSVLTVRCSLSAACNIVIILNNLCCVKYAFRKSNGNGQIKLKNQNNHRKKHTGARLLLIIIITIGRLLKRMFYIIMPAPAVYLPKIGLINYVVPRGALGACWQ